MKIAITSDDKANISQHFGRAPYYIVVTIADGKIVEAWGIEDNLGMMMQLGFELEPKEGEK